MRHRRADGEKEGQGAGIQIDCLVESRHQSAGGDLQAEEREVAPRRDGLRLGELGEISGAVRGACSVMLREGADLTAQGDAAYLERVDAVTGSCTRVSNGAPSARPAMWRASREA